MSRFLRRPASPICLQVADGSVPAKAQLIPQANQRVVFEGVFSAKPNSGAEAVRLAVAPLQESTGFATALPILAPCGPGIVGAGFAVRGSLLEFQE
jgi:hypothetical protein